MKTTLLVSALALIPLITACSQPAGAVATAPARAGFDHSHAALTAVLREHVHGEKVNYAALQKNPARLEAYLDSLAAVSEAIFRQWNKNEQMAFLINLYNAATLKLVIDHYPVKSIKDIGGSLQGPWKQPVVRLFGRRVTLDHIEHGLLRPKYKDPRIHFAVNCASISCPALRPEAFEAAKLDRQFDEQGRLFLRDSSKNRLDADNKTLHLSPIFSWFEGDFTANSGSVGNFVAPYFTEADRKVILEGRLAIKKTNYDWKLNEQ